MHTVKSVTINKNALTWQQLHWDLIFSFLREAVGVSWLTQIKKKNNVLYAVIWISSGEAQQTDKTDRHAGKNQIRFLCLTWWIILSGRFSSQRFFFCSTAKGGRGQGKIRKDGKMLRKVETLLCSFNKWCTDALGTFAYFYFFVIFANKSCWGFTSEQMLTGLFCGWRLGLGSCMCEPQRFYHFARGWVLNVGRSR